MLLLASLSFSEALDKQNPIWQYCNARYTLYSDGRLLPSFLDHYCIPQNQEVMSPPLYTWILMETTYKNIKKELIGTSGCLEIQPENQYHF